jgi:hypothetical protein
MIKQCFECKTDIKFKETYSNVRKRANVLLKHAKRREDSFSRLRAENGGQIKGLKSWPRVLVTVDDKTGMPCIAEDQLTKRFDHYDIFQSLRCVVSVTCSIISLTKFLQARRSEEVQLDFDGVDADRHSDVACAHS